MQSSLAVTLCILGAALGASACNDPTATTGNSTDPDAVASGSGDLDSVSASRRAGTVHLLGDFALYMPATFRGPLAVVVALGGPRTSAIVTGESFGAPPNAEPALQAMGEAMRAFADENRVAILGTSLFGPLALKDGVASDERILAALAEGAAASGRPTLATIPILTFGLSGGGPEASGFAARRPGQVAGVFLKAPSGVTLLLEPAQRRVPTFLALAENDVLVNNAALGQAFAANRSSGALWAMATEPGAVHFSYSDVLRTTTIGWMQEILARRVAGASGRIRPAVTVLGWLGDPATGEVSPWGRYDGDRSAASWFPTKCVAELWQALIGAGTGQLTLQRALGPHACERRAGGASWLR